MDCNRTIELLEIEKKCILRNENEECNRDCANCDIVQRTEDLLEAYEMAIACVTLVKYDLERRSNR